jgi:hypothetical protein
VFALSLPALRERREVMHHFGGGLMECSRCNTKLSVGLDIVNTSSYDWYLPVPTRPRRHDACASF